MDGFAGPSASLGSGVGVTLLAWINTKRTKHVSGKGTTMFRTTDLRKIG